jgi:hypothetical protein
MSALPKELRDQSLHMACAVLVLLPTALWPSLLTFTLAGFGCGLIRETTGKALR